MREEIEALIEAGELESARKAERQLAEALIHRELEVRRQMREDQVRALQEELEVLTIKLQQLEAEGRHDEAADIERGIEKLRRHADEVAEGAD